MKLFLGLFDKSLDISKYDTVLLLFKRENYNEVIDMFKDYPIDLDLWTTITWGDDTYELLPLSKNEVYYKPVYILREVLAPYIADGKPRGWFYDKGIPKRYTGIANAIYFSKDNSDTDFSTIGMYIILKMFSQDSDTIDCSMKAYQEALNKVKDYESSNFISFVQDNSPKEEVVVDDGMKFHFGCYSH